MQRGIVWPMCLVLVIGSAAAGCPDRLRVPAADRPDLRMALSVHQADVLTLVTPLPDLGPEVGRKGVAPQLGSTSGTAAKPALTQTSYGALQAGDGVHSGIKGDYYHDVYTVDLFAGEMVRVSVSSTDFYPQVGLLPPSGHPELAAA